MSRIELYRRIYELEIDAERMKIAGEDTSAIHREINELFRQLRGRSVSSDVVEASEG